MIQRIGIAGGVADRHWPSLIDIVAIGRWINLSGQTDVHRMRWHKTATNIVPGSIELA
jgi:hypothetical protein